MKEKTLPKASDSMRMLVMKLNQDYAAMLHRHDNQKTEEMKQLEDAINELLERYDFDYTVFTAEDGKVGIRSCGGTTVAEPIYDRILFWSRMDPFNGPENAIAQRGAHYVLIDLKGAREVLEADIIFPSDQTLAPVVFAIDGKKGLADSKGNIIIPPSYDSISMITWGYYEITLDGKVGISLPNGVIIKPKFDSIDCGDDDEYYFKVTVDGKEGFIDENLEFTEDESRAFVGVFYS